MTDLFFDIINTSISAAWTVLAVLLVRLFLKRASKSAATLLWMIVALRLVFPFSIQSAFSLIPSAEIVSSSILSDTTPSVDTGIEFINEPINNLLADSLSPGIGDSANPLQILTPVLIAVWLIGMAAILLYAAISYALLAHKLAFSVRYTDNIYRSDLVRSPFILGVFRPRIYIPFGSDDKACEYAILHENAHLARKDHIRKLIAYILLSVHWFNPLIWLAYILFCRDIELACDERAISQLDNEQRADYAQALLPYSSGNFSISVCPTAFSENDISRRVRAILKYRKPALLGAVAAVVLCVVLAVCFLTEPLSPTDSVKLIEHSTPGNGFAAEYALDFSNAVNGCEIWAEQWINGTCSKSSIVTAAKETKRLGLKVQLRKENEVYTGVDIQIDTDESGGSLLTYFASPDAQDILGWSFASFEEEKMYEIAPGDSMVIAALAFDVGNGVRTFSPESLTVESERLMSYDRIIVIKVRACSDEDLALTSKTAMADSK